MKKRKRKKSNSPFGLLVLELIALSAFFFLFTQARDYRNQQAEIPVESVESVSPSQEDHYQLIEASPLEALLASNQASY